LYVCGAPERILERSNLNEKERKKWKKKLEKLTEKGLRVVASAYKIFPSKKLSKKDSLSVDLIENLNFAGFITLRDPVRKGVKQAIKICMRAGMKPILVTGDHKLTAKAIAKEIGLFVKEENILEGKDLDKMSDEELKKRIENIKIYARTEPRHKLRIIQAWQEKGKVVAMTGDGINDAPALKKADIGVAVGSGTDVAKEVADLILLPDSFDIIVAAIEEGRSIIDNIRKVITYLMTSSFAEVILISVSLFLGYPLPVLPGQILWVNLIEDGPLALSLAFEKKEKDVMQRKPEKKESPLLTKEMKVIIFGVGIVLNLLLLGLYFWLFKFTDYDLSHIRSIIFVGLAIDSLFFIFSCKSLHHNIWQIDIFSNRFLIICWIIGFLMLISALYLPPFQFLLKTTSLNFFDWMLLLGIGLISLLSIEIAKWYFIVKRKK